MNTALTSEGKFPLPTTGIDTFDWILGGTRERAERSGRFGSVLVQQMPIMPASAACQP